MDKTVRCIISILLAIVFVFSNSSLTIYAKEKPIDNESTTVPIVLVEKEEIMLVEKQIVQKEVTLISDIEVIEEDFINPIQSNLAYVSCSYGGYQGHSGTDIAVPAGTKVAASKSGVVIKTTYLNYSYGLSVLIEHDDGSQTRYAHLSNILVKEGQEVKQNEQIALSGSTGNSTGPHLHFEIIKDGKAVDAEKIIKL